MQLQLPNLLTTFTLLGLILTIQLSYYPSFKYIDQQQFKTFHKHHTSSILLLVIPLMLLELALSTWLFYQEGIPFLGPLILVLLIWLSTYFIQIPLHNALAEGKDETIIQQLLRTNWIRTILWIGKSIWLTLIYLNKL